MSDDADQARMDADIALLEQLEVGQIYLSREEVFAQDMAAEAFVSTDGVDMRGPLAIANLATAANLVNWHSTDGIIQTLWSFDRALPGRLRAEIDEADFDSLDALFDRLTRENPGQVQSLDEARARYLSAPRPVMLGAAPANTYLKARTQIALRLAFVVAVARDVSACNLSLAQLWFDSARQSEPLLSREEFARRYNADLAGIAGYRRGVGYKGNFFKGLAKSVSKLFRRPADWFRSALKEAGRYAQLHNLPFTWLRKVPYFGVGLAGIGSVFTDELANILIAGKISAFKEQRLVTTIGQVGVQVGLVLQLVGGVLTVFGGPLAPLGGLLATIGVLVMVAGQTVLKLQAMVRQQRLNKEEFLRRQKELERLKRLAEQQQQSADASVVPPRRAAASVPLLLGGAVLVFLAMR